MSERDTPGDARRNHLDQPIGPPVDLPVASAPAGEVLRGDEVELRPLRQTDVDALFDAVAGGDGSQWTYLAFGPCETPGDLAPVVTGLIGTPEPSTSAYLITDRAGRALGTASYLRIDPAARSIEIGSILLGHALQRTRGATEAMTLLMARAFELGYRRLEWKCDALNAPSRAAALRLGFTFEGTFRQALVYKGRNRDTAWFSLLDSEWPRAHEALRIWLEETAGGAPQGRSLAEIRDTISPAE